MHYNKKTLLLIFMSKKIYITTATSTVETDELAGNELTAIEMDTTSQYPSSLPKNKDDLNKELFKAIKETNLSSVNKLIEQGADINATNIDEKTPLHIAAFELNLEIVKVLINAGADVNAKDINLHTPIHIASGWGNEELMERLISAGANVNVINKIQENTPL